MKKYPAIDTESRMRFAVSQKDIYMLCIYTWGFQITLKKKKVSHNDMTSYCHQHIVCNYEAGGGTQGPLSSFLTAAVYLFCVVFVFVSFPFHLYKKFEELIPIYIFCYGHKNAGLESALARFCP